MAHLRPRLLAALLTLLAPIVTAAPALGSSHARGHGSSRCVTLARVHRAHSAGFFYRRRAGCPAHHHAAHHHAARRLAARHAPAVSAPRPARAGSADSSGLCVDATLAPDSHNVERIRAATLCLVNRERAAHGESPLQANPHLQRAAQMHTESMAFGGYFEHTGPGGDTPLARMRAAGYIPGARVGYEVGENIGWGTLTQGTPRAIVAAWMASAGHRANILDARFRDSAIGVSPHPPANLAHGQSGGIYTQDFGVIISN